MSIVVRRKNTFRTQLLVLILLSILAGIVGGGLVGIATQHRSSAPAAGTT